MSLMDRMRERRDRKTIERLEENRKDTIANATSSDAKDRIRSFTSVRAILRKSVPMMIMGFALAFVEYEIIGVIYTLASLVVYIPLMYFYTRSVIPVSGKYILHIQGDKGSLRLTRYLIPDEIFELMEFDFPLIPGLVRFNGHETYLVTQLWKLENGVIWKAKLAFLHTNVLEYARNSGVLNKAVDFATNLALANAELENLEGLLSILEEKRQKKEQLDLIDKAYRESPMQLKNRISEIKERINDLMRRNHDLIYGPENEEELLTTGEG